MNAVQVTKNMNKFTTAILVLGACENHGDHMPFGADSIVPMELAKRVAKKLEGKVFSIASDPLWSQLASYRFSHDYKFRT